MSARETEWEHCEIRLGSWLSCGSLGQDIEDYISNENKNHFIFLVKYLILYQDLSVQNIWITEWYHLWSLATNILTRKQDVALIWCLDPSLCLFFSVILTLTRFYFNHRKIRPTLTGLKTKRTIWMNLTYL